MDTEVKEQVETEQEPHTQDALLDLGSVSLDTQGGWLGFEADTGVGFTFD